MYLGARKCGIRDWARSVVPFAKVKDVDVCMHRSIVNHEEDL